MPQIWVIQKVSGPRNLELAPGKNEEMYFLKQLVYRFHGCVWGLMIDGYSGVDHEYESYFELSAYTVKSG